MAAARRQSPLSRTANQRRNTRRGRNRMKRSSFALPKGTGSKPNQANYRVDDLAHARNALARVSQHGTRSEQQRVRRVVAARFPSIGRSSAGKAGSGAGRRTGRGRRREQRTKIDNEQQRRFYPTSKMISATILL